MYITIRYYVKVKVERAANLKYKVLSSYLLNAFFPPSFNLEKM